MSGGTTNTKGKTIRRALHWSGVIALAMAAHSNALAQDSAEADEGLVVTGSRVVRDGFSAPTPVTVLGAEQLQQAAPSTLSDALAQLPEFRMSLRPQATGVGTTGNVGQSFLNLRNLDGARTLILLDGRRIVPSTAGGSTDIAVIPEGLIERVEVVTGGASAAYGSDAVAGVVNFVLDNDYTGFKGAVQGGRSTYGDADNFKVTLTHGRELFGGRGHLLVSGEYYDNDGVVEFQDRDWFQSWSRIPVPGAGSLTTIVSGVHSAGFTEGGLINGGPLNGTQFLPGGVPAQFFYGDLRSSLAMVGGSGTDHGKYWQPVPGQTRKSAFARFTYDLTPDVNVFFEGLFTESLADYGGTHPWEGQSTQFQIQRDNAFLDPATAARMDAAGVTTFNLWRYDTDFGIFEVLSRNDTMRFTGGFDWDMGGGWTMNAYYEYGQNIFKLLTGNNPELAHLYRAVDAVVDPGTGRIICRSTLTFPTDGCVPLNLFGFGSPSPEALDYVLGTTWQRQKLTQDVFEASVAGDVFDLWAGPVSVAFGGGYRREETNQVVDEISTRIREFSGGYKGWPTALTGQLGGWERTNPQPIAGEYDLWETFGEVVVPLAHEQPFAYSLEFNGAIRYTDYSTSGGVTTWKAGLTYEPIPDLRLRVTRSRDIRAANLNELFLGSNQGQGNLDDPFTGTRPVVFTRTSGNPNLTPEEADTITYGVVYSPSWFDGFRFSVDYYDIQIADAIGTLGGQTTIDQCFQGATQLCSLLTRDATGVLVSVSTPFLNIAERTVNGVDIEASYRTPLDRFVSSWSGDLSVRILANYIGELTFTNPGAPTIDRAGETGQTAGVPEWSANWSLSYDNGPLLLYFQQRWIDEGIYNVTLTPAQLAPSENVVAGITYTDVSARYKLGESYEIYGTINNLTNEDPNPAPGPFFVFGTTHTNNRLFEYVGRAYTVGLRFSF